MPECTVSFYVLGMHKFVPHMKLTTFFWLSWEQCICHPCSFYAGCLACYMLHFNGKNLISERSLKLVPLHTTIPTKGITNESQWSRSCQELPTDTATHPWPKKIWFWGFKTGVSKTNFTEKLEFIKGQLISKANFLVLI